jgi:hypothetical protein
MDVTFIVICILMALPIVAVLLAISLFTPSWHWVVGFIILAGGALISQWIQHWMAAPGAKEGPSGGLGILIVEGWSVAFGIASLGYILGLLWVQWRRE